MSNMPIGSAKDWQSLRTVTPIRRLFAHLVDQSLWLGAVFWQFSVISDSDSPSGGEGLAPTAAIVILLVAYLVLAAKGKTVGKWMMGIKIIKNDGTSAGFGTVFVRDVLGKIISTAFLYLGFLWILLDSRNQGWHDKLMGTTVVYANEHADLMQEE